MQAVLRHRSQGLRVPNLDASIVGAAGAEAALPGAVAKREPGDPVRVPDELSCTDTKRPRMGPAVSARHLPDPAPHPRGSRCLPDSRAPLPERRTAAPGGGPASRGRSAPIKGRGSQGEPPAGPGSPQERVVAVP